MAMQVYRYSYLPRSYHPKTDKAQPKIQLRIPGHNMPDLETYL